MALRVYNTLSRQKEPLETLQPGKVAMYVCGPTVYSKAHVGHAMSALVFDVIRRYLEYRGYQVRHVMNYTDVDDKIIQRSNQEGVPLQELAERYIQEYQHHLADLNVLPATLNPRATQEIDSIIRIIQDLIENGFAYVVGGDVYFRVMKDPEYGKLSGRNPEDMIAGARIEVDERKENPLDFALWKAAKPGEPAWKNPWGLGRPGWHIECSAMNLDHLGPQIDIHGGGNDLIFPHHENEIAQTESLTGQQFARYWMHHGMMQLSGEKMSKSLGNLVTIASFLQSHEGDVLRMMILNSSYRNPLTYSEETVEQAERALDRLRTALRRAPEKTPLTSSELSASQAREALKKQMEAARQGFLESMDDDFNTAGALGYIFELVRTINQAADRAANAETISAAQGMLRELTGVLGLRLEQPQAHNEEAGPFIDLLVELRSQKLWGLADQVRTQLAELGVVLEDNKEGTTWRWNA